MSGYKSKCWYCSKSTNKNKCIWVATLKERPQGCVCDCDSNVIDCPEFEKMKALSHGEILQKICEDFNLTRDKARVFYKKYGNYEAVTKAIQKQQEEAKQRSKLTKSQRRILYKKRAEFKKLQKQKEQSK